MISDLQDKRNEIEFFDTGKKDESHEWWYEKAIRRFGLSTNGAQLLLDAGFGTGGWAVRLAKKGYNVIGVDISRKMLKSAKSRCNSDKIDFHPILSDLERLPFKSDTFNVCFGAFILHHFRNLKFLITELSRIMKPNGKTLFLEPNGLNIPLKLAGTMFAYLPKELIMKRSFVDPNQWLHTPKSYVKILRDCGIFVTDILPFVVIEQLNLRCRRSLMDFLEEIRNLNFNLGWKLLPKPIGGSAIMLKCISQKGQKRGRI